MPTHMSSLADAVLLLLLLRRYLGICVTEKCAQSPQSLGVRLWADDVLCSWDEVRL